MKRLPGDVQGALCSLVFNRGGDMTGDRRLEMRQIRDAIVDSSLTMKQRLLSIEASIRAMERIWRGTDVGRGLIKRRNAEADLVRSCV
jgi:GH24 family phage-related lysozyme (muramidase)